MNINKDIEKLTKLGFKILSNDNNTTTVDYHGEKVIIPHSIKGLLDIKIAFALYGPICSIIR